MFRLAVGIIVIATFVGVLMPANPGVDGGNKPAEVEEPWFAESGSSVSNTTAGASNSGGEVRLTRDRDGHFYADVDVNGTNVEFMIDTGATSIALTPEDARRVGLNLAAAEQTYVGQGAGGALTGQFVRLDRVRLGSRTASGIDAAVIEGASTNLLGQSFLAQFQEVSVRGDVMTLR